ncbi:MAG TPA: hypothetical protein VJR89_10280 [Polyangiales bacterium]|nr:hypothetical protein [Polyangiales bacterium]
MSLSIGSCAGDTTSDDPIDVGVATGAIAALLPNGKSCSIANQCASNFCIDGVCCNTACGGTAIDCQACNQEGSVGTCSLLGAETPCRAPASDCDAIESCSGTSIECPPDTYAAPGTACSDDGNACTADVCDGSLTCQHPAGNAGTVCRPTAGPCDAAESCDGSSSVCPSDGFASAGTACGEASCSAGVATLISACSGSSLDCPNGPTQPCNAYVCGANSCLTTCSADSQCADGFFCDAGSCTPKLASGSACTTADHCASGFCADGFCCNTACQGQCEACDLASSRGTCSPATGAPRGGRPACASDGTSCGGSCDGTQRTQCGYPNADVVCRDPSCSDGVATLTGGCNGSGACAAPSYQPCSPFICVPGGQICAGNCQGDTDCAPGNWCSAGICVPLRELGETCSAFDQCVSGKCVDGICCDSACEGQCEACDIPGLEGTCSGTIGAPRGARPACASDGSSCGGQCDGDLRDACHYPDSGVLCRDPSCSAGTAVVAGFCNGAGACPALETRDCAPYVCGADSCRGDCKADVDCADGQFCQAGMCTAKRDNGQSCSGANACESGQCVDGVCCDSACTGQCEACDVAGSAGACTAVVGKPHGARSACTGTDGNACAGQCDGVQRTTCSYPGTETTCRRGSCIFGSAILAATCTGTGSCPDVQKQSCTPYVCGVGACKGNCVDSSSCQGSFFCSAGMCVPKLDNGASCGSNDQCYFGHCIDGVCCDSACDGQCEACDVTGHAGVCLPVKGTPHGGRATCAGSGVCAGQCDGVETRACSFPDASVTCVQPSCDSGISTARTGCDGSGSCSMPVRRECAPYQCGQTSCRTTCQNDSECDATTVCISGQCKPRDSGTPDGGVDGGTDGGVPPGMVDSDGDGIPDVKERDKKGRPRDTDKDGKIDELDPDDDNDGIPTIIEHREDPKQDDLDQDGIPNHLDYDSDGDGIPDSKERKTGDTDHDGIPDVADPVNAGVAGGACSASFGSAAHSGGSLGFFLLALGAWCVRRKRRGRA